MRCLLISFNTLTLEQLSWLTRKLSRSNRSDRMLGHVKCEWKGSLLFLSQRGLLMFSYQTESLECL